MTDTTRPVWNAADIISTNLSGDRKKFKYIDAQISRLQESVLHFSISVDNFVNTNHLFFHTITEIIYRMM